MWISTRTDTTKCSIFHINVDKRHYDISYSKIALRLLVVNSIGMYRAFSIRVNIRASRATDFYRSFGPK